MRRFRTGGHNAEYATMAEWFLRADLIVVGHDGVFGPESCGVLMEACRAGKRCGILGAGMSEYSVITPIVNRVLRNAIGQVSFAVFREGHAYQTVSRLTQQPERLILAPDPAFAMVPSSTYDVTNYLDRNPLVKDARQNGLPVLCATVCHKDVLLRRTFAKAKTTAQKHHLHIAYLATTLTAVMEGNAGCLIFLPHSLEGMARNDVRTAEAVLEALPGTLRKRVAVLQDDISARMLKGIIASCDFLIGQRAHSMIGSASVATPFAGLVSSNDRRTHEIIGEMCGYQQGLINMDCMSPTQAAEWIQSLYRQRQVLKGILSNSMLQFRKKLSEVSVEVLGREVV
jgi:polysaccharide pyruvyl transferase WcaK-like protein